VHNVGSRTESDHWLSVGGQGGLDYVKASFQVSDSVPKCQ